MVTSDNTRLMNEILPEVRTSRMDVEKFDSGKIIDSLMRETGINQDTAEKVTITVLKRILQSSVQWLSGPAIREMCCSVLAEMGLLEARRRYTRIGMPLMDYEELLTEGIKENANQYDNPESIHSWAADRIASEYALLRLLTEEQSKAHLKGDIHVHMLRYFDLRPFCQEWDLRMILQYGLPPCGWRHSAVSKPANHAMVAILHAAKWLGIVQGEFSGGQGYDNFTVFMAPYLKGASYEDAMQLAQCFLFETNQIYAARGAQVPFTSISCLPTIPDSLQDVPAVSFGGQFDGVYGDYHDECNLFFRALCDVYCKGDGTGKLFNFPKHEIKIKKEWVTKYEGEYLLVAKETAKFGLPYYLNMMADWMPDEVHSQCLPYSEPLIVRIDGETSLIPIGKLVSDEIRGVEKESSGVQSPLWIEPCKKIEVLSIDPITQKINYQPVTGLFYNPTESQIITFKTQGGLEISTNENHPLIVLDQIQKKLKAKKAKDVTLGEFILQMTKWESPQINSNNIKEFDLIDILIKRGVLEGITVYGVDDNLLKSEIQSDLAIKLDVPVNRICWWRRTHSISLKAYLQLESDSTHRTSLQLVPKRGKGFINAKIPCDENLMTYLGYYLAEGSLHKNRGVRLSFNPEEKEKIEEVEKLVKKVFGLNIKKDLQVDPIKNYNCCNISINSQLLLELTEYWDLGSDARSKQLPNFTYDLPNELTGGLIRALFLGDGYFRTTKDSVEVSLHISSEKLAQGVHYLLLKHGINSTIRRKANSINLSIERGKSIELFMNLIPEWKGAYIKKESERKRPLSPISRRFPSILIEKNGLKNKTDRGIVSQSQKENRTIGEKFIRKIPETAHTELLKILMGSEFFNLVKVIKIERKSNSGAFYDLEVGLLGTKGNFVHGDGLVTHNCCRIILTPDGIRKICNDPDLFDWNKSFMNLGSLQSVSLNLPRYAYQARGDDDLLFEYIDKNLELSKEILIIKQRVLQRAMEHELIPICASRLNGVPLLDFRKQSLSIGFVGLNECIQAHTGYQLHEDPASFEFGKKILHYLHKKCEEFTETNLVKFSLWEQPAESTSERFAKLDLLHYPNEAIPLGERPDYVYYTNSDHLNYAADIPLFERIEKQSEFHPIVQGGVITHIWMGEAHPDAEGLWKFTKAIAKTPTAYFTFTKDFTQCMNCLRFIDGIYNTCPYCGASDDAIEWWSRVTGYYSRVKRFNKGKFQEWHDRKRYDLATSA